MGKAYANRKQEKDRPESDYYVTPKSLVWELIATGELDKSKLIYDPCTGDERSLAKALINDGFTVEEDDLRTTGKDFLKCTKEYPQIVENPPFSLFDEFVLKSKELAPRAIILGKTNFFGAYNRWNNGVWKNLKHLYIFNRQCDYRTPDREDGLFHVGNLITSWMVFDRDWEANWWRTSIIDVQKYAKLGGFKE